MPKSTQEVATISSDQLAMLNAQGGGQSVKTFLPSLALEHTTNRDGDANPLKGHYTLSAMNDLGEWEKKDLGSDIEIQFILRRYYLQLMIGTTKYFTKEFDRPDEAVDLMKSVGEGDSRVLSLHKKGTYAELSGEFMEQDDKGRVRTKLKRLSVLYASVGGEMVKWKMNSSAAIAYSKYSDTVIPFSVVTAAGVEEMKNGTVKFFKPLFRATGQVNNIQDVLEAQTALRTSFESSAYELPKDEPAEPVKPEVIPFDL